MKRWVVVVYWCLLGLLLAGCTTVATVSSSLSERADKAAEQVERICALEEAERAVVRERVDRRVEPHAVRIECEGDP